MKFATPSLCSFAAIITGLGGPLYRLTVLRSVLQLITTNLIHAVVGLISIVASSAINAATFTTLCNNRSEMAAKACTIKLSGQIVAGDSERLRAELSRPLLDGWRYGTLLLDSPGGSVSAALEVATIVRQALLDTQNYRLPTDDPKMFRPGDRPPQMSWNCVSACFLVWVAGANRSTLSYYNDSGKNEGIGLHRPYLEKSAYQNTPERVAMLQQQVMQATSEYLKREQIPQSLIEKMLQRASTQVYWLSNVDENITGYAAWFQEMMISRCDYDPTYDGEMTEWIIENSMKDLERRLESRNKKFEPTDLGPRYAAYVKWRQNYNACEYGIRQSAQEALRR